MTIKWAYGVTTIPRRFEELLPRTLVSLARSGFDKPRLFIDGGYYGELPSQAKGLEVTKRVPNIRPYGNWILGLAELYIREPGAELYAMFQDDIVCCKNLRVYLEKCGYPPKGYWNLFTTPQNTELAPLNFKGVYHGEMKGWYESNQMGRGALGLVFSREGVINLLTHQHMVERPLDVRIGHRNIDGGVVTAMKKSGYREYVHYPSLVQHTGAFSTIGNHCPSSDCFLGENWSPL